MNEMKFIEIPSKEVIDIDKGLLDKLDLPLYEDVSDPQVKEFRSLEESLNDITKEETDIYDNANLEENEVNNRPCLTRNDIDYDTVDGRGQTNIQRMQDGKPPLIDGKPVELHHIGQKQDAPLAELTVEEHRGPGNDGILHDKSVDSEINRNEFKKEREQHWEARAKEIIAERGNE